MIWKQFTHLGNFPPELKARFNSFLTTEFDDSLSVEMQLRSIIKWCQANFETVDTLIDFINDISDWLTQFENNFDTKLEDTVGSVLSKWQSSGKLNDIISHVLQWELDVFKTETEQNFTSVNQQLQQKADVVYVDQTISTMTNGAIKGTYTTLTALETAYPQGAVGPFLVEETQHRYIWDINKFEWVSIGVYDPAEIADGSVKLNSLAPSLIDFITGLADEETMSIKGRYGVERGIYKINSDSAYLEGNNLFKGYDIGYVQVGVGLQGGYSDRRRSQPIALSESEQLTLTISGDINRHVWAFLDVNGNDMGIGIDEQTVTAPVGAYWAQCYYYNGADNPPSSANVQIEIGVISTPYVPNKRVALSINQIFEVDSNVTIVAPYRSELTQFVEKKIIDNKPKIYGVKYEPVQSSVLLTRNHDNNDDVDFDTVFPWSDMKVCNVIKSAWGSTQIVYANDSEFSLSGAKGDVMVEIPKHYFRRYRQDGYEHIEISAIQLEGFTCDPAFIENGVELDSVYVGRYLNYFDGDVPKSISGHYPTSRINISEAVVKSEAKGKGYSIYDLRTLHMLQRLFLVEFANKNSQSIYGGITKRVYHGKPDCIALVSDSDTNQITVSIGADSDKFRVGQRCSVSKIQEYQDRYITNIVSNTVNGQRLITFDGTPVTIVQGETYIYSNPEINGQTDFLPDYNGRLIGDSDKVAFSYRGIENMWGNLHELIAGTYTKDGVAYISHDMTSYSELPIADDVKMTTFKLPNIPYTADVRATTPFIRSVGFDVLNPHIMLPNTAGTSTVGQDYWCDEINAPHLETPQNLAHGGGWDHYERSGLFNYRYFIPHNQTDGGWLNGTRLMFKNI